MFEISDKALNRAIIITGVLVIIFALVFGIYYYLDQRGYTAVPLVERDIQKGEKAVKAEPANVNIRLRLADLYIQNKQIDQAIGQYKVVLKINPDYEEAIVGLGIAYMEKGLDSKAIVQFKKEIKIAENKQFSRINQLLEKAYYLLGTVYLKQKKYDQAIKQFKMSLLNEPTASDTRYHLGIVYFKKGSYDQAIAQFKEALKYDPLYAQPHYGLGLVYEKRGEKGKAIDEYKKALKKDPDLKQAQGALDRLR